MICKSMNQACFRYSWSCAIVKKIRSLRASKHERRYPQLLALGEMLQSDVKGIPYNCLQGKIMEKRKALVSADRDRRMYLSAIGICLWGTYTGGFCEVFPDSAKGSRAASVRYCDADVRKVGKEPYK